MKRIEGQCGKLRLSPQLWGKTKFAAVYENDRNSFAARRHLSNVKLL
jgi:hypothetical protein